MISRADLPASHFGGSIVCGVGEDFAAGVKITPNTTGNRPSLNVFGDDSNMGLDIGAQVGGVIQQRVLINAVPKTIVDGSATSLFDVSCLSGAMSAGTFHYAIRASDGTDHQMMCGVGTYAMVNKAGTNTLTITVPTANDAKAVSSGTLTTAWTFVTGTNKGTVKVQPTGSLTETTYTIEYTVFPIRGAVTIL